MIHSTQTSIHIGQQAGKELYHAIRNAQESVRIISPYTGPDLLKELVRLSKNGVAVELATTEDFERLATTNKGRTTVEQLVIQEVHTNKKGVALKYLYHLLTGLCVVGLGATIFALVSHLSQDNHKPPFVLGTGILLILFFAIYFAVQARQVIVESFSYQNLFPIKAFRSPKGMGGNRLTPLIHSKIYLIDDELAFLGSLNFTSAGFKDNFETCIKVSDPVAVAQIIEQVDRVFTEELFEELGPDELGARLYELEEEEE